MSSESHTRHEGRALPERPHALGTGSAPPQSTVDYSQYPRMLPVERQLL